MLSTICPKCFYCPSTDLATIWSITDKQSNDVASGIFWGNDSLVVRESLERFQYNNCHKKDLLKDHEYNSYLIVDLIMTLTPLKRQYKLIN